MRPENAGDTLWNISSMLRVGDVVACEPLLFLDPSPIWSLTPLQTGERSCLRTTMTKQREERLPLGLEQTGRRRGAGNRVTSRSAPDA